ncbi:YbhN family protein [Streptomyces sp. NPDC088732]|uniref:lysylphosphatidylglycerol synthase transmembrane domain-containing protein n=1 Tax=Streptomyces sp. NPDC088732 TaxID=3365879 RepID=UPI0037FAD23D
MTAGFPAAASADLSDGGPGRRPSCRAVRRPPEPPPPTGPTGWQRFRRRHGQRPYAATTAGVPAVARGREEHSGSRSDPPCAPPAPHRGVPDRPIRGTTATALPGPSGPGGRRPGRQPGRARWLGAAAVVAAVVFAGFLHRSELAEAYALIGKVRGSGLAVAVACEALSLVCFAAVPRRLLAVAGRRWSLRTMTAVVLAGNAVAGVLPGGAAFASAWVYGQFRRRGVEPTLAIATLAAAGALSALGLTAVVVAGIFSVGATGTSAFVRPVAGVLLLGCAAVLTVVALSRSPHMRDAAHSAWVSAGRRSARVRRGQQALDRVAVQARALHPGVRTWLRPACWALLNWLFDAACLVACTWALGIGVPWHGLLLAYGLTQLSGSLRLTPGSLGVVEAGLSALLVACGLAPGSAIAVTLLYRAVSFWAVQPVGWAAWCAVTARRV